MPPSKPVRPEKTLHEVSHEMGLYPVEAYEFVQQGLAYTVRKIHGAAKEEGRVMRHVSGQDLCEGIRELALNRWGLLARTVLGKWNIRRTVDFGKIVFAMVNSGILQATDEDTIEDFKDVYDFGRAFEREYRLEKLI
ncbi:MAG TPA: Minf_1886 family protein [Tepidisphaeraceae bacterium]